MEEERVPVRELLFMPRLARFVISPIEEGRVPVIPLLLKSIEVTTPLVQVIPIHEHLSVVTSLQSHSELVLVATLVEEIKSHRTPSSTLPYVVGAKVGYRVGRLEGTGVGTGVGASHS
jgi:hypothetical protein